MSLAYITLILEVVFCKHEFVGKRFQFCSAEVMVFFFFFFRFALGFSDLLYTAAQADAKAVSSWKITMVQYLCVRISFQKLKKTFFKAVPQNKVQLKFRNHIYFRKAEINQTIYLSMFYLFLLVATVYCFPNTHTLTPVIPGR